jgi:hypothetical protein
MPRLECLRIAAALLPQATAEEVLAAAKLFEGWLTAP